ncbi:hypothetical protein FRB96_001648 [Tulasnella sp. 330]|nr:hypothetical protein FRB96_001648 [Tulasnella sp. 330]KAG8878002.1 hypothetical protein FRB97_002848 [Tulasnella sp. 331]
MGLRVATLIISTSFLLGILFTHWIADSLTLWQSPLTDEHLRTAAIYYESLASLPDSMQWFLVAVAFTGGMSLLASVWDGEAGNLMFDGASIYLRTITGKPIPPDTSKYPRFPEALRQPTIEMATSHLMIGVALTGVLFFQALRSWAESEDQSQREEDEREAREEEEEQERLRIAAEADRGRHRKVVSSDEENDEPVTSPMTVSATRRKSSSARRKDVRASGKGSLGRASGSSIRRMS